MTDSPFSALVRQLLTLTQEKRAAVLAKLQIDNPDGYNKLSKYFKQNRGAVDEALGYEHWLKKLGAQTFTRPLAPIQKRFWEWNWSILQKLLDDIPLESREFLKAHC